MFTSETGGAPNAAFTFVNSNDHSSSETGFGSAAPLVAVLIEASSFQYEQREKASSTDEGPVPSPVSQGGPSNSSETILVYEYKLTQSESQASVLSLESFFELNDQSDVGTPDDQNRPVVETTTFVDCTLFIDSGRSGRTFENCVDPVDPSSCPNSSCGGVGVFGG